jgi:hypothetical protein
MDLIQDIYQKLSLQEIKRIKSQIRNNPHEFEKVGKLFELLVKYPKEEENFFARKLYQKDAENSFRVTKARLKKLMEESLLGERSLKEYDAEHVVALLTTKKRLIQGEILMGRGAYAASKNLLEQVIVTSKKYFFLEECFHAQMLLFRHACNSMPATELLRAVEELRILSQQVAQYQEASILYYRMSGLLASTTFKDAQEFEDALNTLNVLKHIWETTAHPQIGFYYLKIAIYYHLITHDSVSARRFSQELLELVRQSPALQSRQREGAALLQLSEVCLRGGEFHRASTFIKATLSLYKTDEVNFLIALETDFRIAFFKNDLNRCNDILKQAVQHPMLAISKIRIGRWKYFEAALRFKEGNFRECNRQLIEATPVMADKSGWNIALRLLEIMSLYEAGKRDILDSRIENLKQFIRRTQPEEDTTRGQLLTEIISIWHKHQFDFFAAESYLKKEIARLQDYHHKVPFNPASFELIRLEEWIEQHSLGKGKL